MDAPKPESTSENTSCGGTRPAVELVRPSGVDMTKVEGMQPFQGSGFRGGILLCRDGWMDGWKGKDFPG